MILSSDGQSHNFLVDDEDIERINKLKWRAHKWRHVWYAQSWIIAKNINSRTTTIMLHRFIVGCPKGKVVDHINGNGYDCRKSNLRVCSDKQNCWNRGVNRNSKTGFRGVNKRKNSFIARIRVNDTLIHLGSYRSAVDAAIEYNKAAKKHYGEFAWLNQIPKTEH